MTARYLVFIVSFAGVICSALQPGKTLGVGYISSYNEDSYNPTGAEQMGDLKYINVVETTINNLTDIRNKRFNYFYDWMQPLSNSLSLGELTMPGTHDTMSRYGGAAVETQSLTLWQQLMYGIRALDIRCRHIENVCAIHHGPVFQNAFLRDVLDDSVSFLSRYPSEVIVMRLKEEYNPADNDRPLTDTIEWYLSDAKYSQYIWRGGDGSTVPTLGQVRGKIVILDQIGGGKFGINWFKCGACNSPCVSPCIQDMYVVNTILPGDINTKWNYVNDHLSRVDSGPPNNFYLNFLSGVSSGAYPNAVADRINIRFIEHMRIFTLHYGKVGAIMMDFPLAEELMQIIDINFHDMSVHAKVFEHQYEAGESKVFTVQPNYCITFGHWNDRASSIDTMGKCVKIWEHSECRGAWRNVNSDSDDCAYSLARCGWNDHVSSISHC